MTVLITVFYKEKFFHCYSQQLQTLFQEWDRDVQKLKEEEENLAVGIRLSFITSFL